MKEPQAAPKRRATAEDVAIGQKLRALRLDRGLSQSKLAAMIGVSFQQLQKYEKGGNRISAGRLARLAAELRVPVMTFYGLTGRPEREQSFTYLRSAGIVRIARAVAAIEERGPRAAVVMIVEALARGKR